eukprot:gnl/Spiro4/10832_TR5765_c0_g8_i1.p1 gnl/Spiro4/10832_TR5765_c0_g8~~gnl/Spiro4/10832_TR5765_c0_g8_i1.p1  ORF type:complete len:180 (+),score=31.64 gnl/Spiro4/10832_TR5765_c0_g8_i1:69-542(+)
MNKLVTCFFLISTATLLVLAAPSPDETFDCHQSDQGDNLNIHVHFGPDASSPPQMVLKDYVFTVSGVSHTALNSTVIRQSFAKRTWQYPPETGFTVQLSDVNSLYLSVTPQVDPSDTVYWSGYLWVMSVGRRSVRCSREAPSAGRTWLDWLKNFLHL